MTIHLTLAGICEVVVGGVVIVAVVKALYYAWLLWRWDKL